jgi:hypothetical protein
MLSRFVGRLSYANVIATVALFAALGGSSYAALNLPKASVGPKQLKKNSVSSPKVKRGSLLVSDFKASQRASLRGPQGPEGPRGEVGPSGATKVISRQSDFQIIPADTSQTAKVDCNPGEVATGGGIQITNDRRDHVGIRQTTDKPRQHFEPPLKGNLPTASGGPTEQSASNYGLGPEAVSSRSELHLIPHPAQGAG